MIEFFKKSPVLILTTLAMIIALLYIFAFNKAQDNNIQVLKAEVQAISNKIRVADTMFLYSDEPFPATKEEFDSNKTEMQKEIALKANVINIFIIDKYNADQTLSMMKYILFSGFVVWAIRRIYYNSKTLT